MRGHIKAGGIVLEEPIDLPEGTQVEVSPVQADAETRSTTGGEVFKDLIGSAKDLPSDLAANHDHYIHGNNQAMTPIFAECTTGRSPTPSL